MDDPIRLVWAKEDDAGKGKSGEFMAFEVPGNIRRIPMGLAGCLTLSRTE